MKFAIPTQVPLYYNPAFAGCLEEGRVAVTYRNQWAGIPRNPQIGYASWDQLFDRLKGGVGAYTHFDRMGALSYGTLGGVYAPKLQLGRTATLSPAIGMEVGFRSLDVDGLVFSQPDPSIPDSDTTIWIPDFQLGLLVNGSNWYLGASIQHLLEPKMGLIPIGLTPGDGNSSVLTRSYFVQAGYVFKPTRQSDWSVSLNGIAMFQTPFSHYQGMMSGQYKKVILGVGGDSAGDILCLVGYKSRPLKVTYTYSIVTSTLSTATWGSHELSILLYLPRN